MWLPGAERIEGNSSGAMNGDGSRKLLLHTTEGSSIAGAVGAYRTNNSWPTLTVDCPERRVVEHMPLEVAARSLKNKAGGVETNRDGTCLVQIEIVGSAVNPLSIGSPADLVWFGREVVGPICRLLDIPVRSTVTWRSYPASYGESASQRLSAGAWDVYDGLLGHQHAPENDHGDPGAINIGVILAAAQPPDEEFHLVDEADKTILRNIIRQEMYGVDDGHKVGLAPIVRNEVRAIVEEMMTTSGSVVRTEGRVLAKLGCEDALPDEAPTPPV